MIHAALWIVSFCVVLWFGSFILVLLIATWKIWVPILALLIIVIVVSLNSKRDETKVVPVAYVSQYTPPPAPAAPPAKPPDPSPNSPIENQQVMDSVASAVSAATLADTPPRPVFAKMDERVEYLRWLGASSEVLKDKMPEARKRIEFLETLWYESKRTALEPALVLGLIEVTSNFRKYAVNSAGARGYMQVAPWWSKEIGDGDSAKLFHTQANLRFGCVILRHYLEAAQGDLFSALVRYFGQTVGAQAQAPDGAAVSFVDAVLVARRRWTVADAAPASAAETPAQASPIFPAPAASAQQGASTPQAGEAVLGSQREPKATAKDEPN